VAERQAGQGQSPRRARLRALPTPTDVEMYVDDAPPLLEVIDELPEPRIADLDALLREVDELRSVMRRDLSLAATAAEAGADDLAGWLLLGEDGRVKSFEERALAHLAALESCETDEPAAAITPLPAPRRKARMLPAAPFVAAAAAVVGFLTGVVPGTGSPVTSPKTSNSAMQSYAQLAQLASSGASTSRLTAAAQQFHKDLAPLVAAAGSNPAAAEKAIALLQSERAVIAGQGDSPALQAVLAQAEALVLRLRATLPRYPLHTVVAPPVYNDSRSGTESSRSSHSARPSASPSPAAASAKASPSPSRSPSASPSPQPSGSASPDGGLPHAPGTLPG
jgi:hypothetical protein